MALNGSGAISIGGSTSGQSINLELSKAAGATTSLNDADVRALAGISSGAISLNDFHGASAFEGYEESVTTAGSGTKTIPTGASSLVLTLWGAGSGGGKQQFGSDTGGGSGAFMQYTVPIASADWGQSISYTVGTKGAGRTATGTGQGTSGTATTISASLDAGSVSMSAGGGQNNGSGGTFSGNYDTASNGGNSSGNNGGAAPFTSGGIRAEAGEDSVSPYVVWTTVSEATSGSGSGSGGGGGIYEISGVYLNDPVDINGASGNDGAAVFTWS